MRLAIFHPAFESVGGAEILAATQITYYRDQGLAPELVTLGFDPQKWAPRLSGIPVHIVAKRHWTDLFHAWTGIAKLRRRGERAAALLKEYDLVVAHNFPASALLGAAPVRVRKVWQCNEPPRGVHMREANPALTARLLATSGKCEEEATRHFQHDLAIYDRRMSKNSTALARKAYDLASCRNLDLIYAISEFSRNNARQIYGRCEEKVIYPVVRFPEGGRIRQGLDRTVRRVLVHSRLEVMKNIDTVIRGFARFSQRSPVPCELHVVGEGVCRAGLESLAGEICPQGTVHFHGYLSDGDLRSIYDACDVFALLTLDEPFGMVYPEAAARGLLLVGPDHGGPFEILDGGRLGWTINPFSSEALSDALESIWTLDDAEVDRRRELADQACRSRYSMAAVGPALMGLFKP